MKKQFLFLILCIGRLPENTGGFTSSAAGGTSMGNRIAGCTAVLHSVFHRDPHV